MTSRRFVTCFLVMIVCGGGLFAQNKSSATVDDPILAAMKAEMERSKQKLKLPQMQAPYYIEYRVTDIDQFDGSAVFGALKTQQRVRGRLLRVVVRIGDYKQDSYYGSGEGVADLLATDDDVFALRNRLWLARLGDRSGSVVGLGGILDGWHGQRE